MNARFNGRSVKGWLLAAVVAILPSLSHAAPAASLESAVGKAAEIAKQAKEFSKKKAQAARPEAAPKFALDAGGSLRNKETRLVYSGQYEKCYNISFTQRQGVPGSPDSYTRSTILVYANGQHVENLSNPGESTDVCGRIIKIEGWTPYGDGTIYWQAVERRP